MSTLAAIGYGTLMQRGNADGPPETFTTIAEVRSIKPPQSEADDIDVTHMLSPSGYREFIQGLKDAGEASFTVNWIPNDPTQAETGSGLLALAISGAVRTWRIVLPNSALVWTFSGYVKSFNPDIPVDDAMTADVTIKVSGASTFA